MNVEFWLGTGANRKLMQGELVEENAHSFKVKVGGEVIKRRKPRDLTTGERIKKMVVRRGVYWWRK